MPAPTHSVAGDDLVVHVEGLTKRFGNTLAVDDVSLDVHRSELVVLLGLSGSGKSTFLRCLNGLHPTSSGLVDVVGHRVDQAGGVRCVNSAARSVSCSSTSTWWGVSAAWRTCCSVGWGSCASPVTVS